MADSSKPASEPKGPVLLPQGEHAGKPAMPLGHHQFTLIGSRNRAHLHLLSSTVSRNHACIVNGKSGMYIRDLASRSGVLINGRRVREVEIQDGDLVQVGSFKFKFQEPIGAIHLATTPRPPVAMLEIDGHTLTPIDGRTTLIGRRPTCDIPLDSPAVSNTHAIIFETDGRRYIRDLGSRTGTQVNGTAVHQQAIEIGDQINIGGSKLRYVAADVPVEEAEHVAEAIPLDVDLEETIAPEPAAAEEAVPAPIGLHFDEEAETAASAPAHPNDESLPLATDDDLLPMETAEAEPPVAAPIEEASSIPLEFASESPAPAHIPDEALPSAIEAHPVEHGLTASAAASVEADEGLADFWSPPADQGMTADAGAQAPAVAEPELPPFRAEEEPAPAIPEALEEPIAAEEPLPAFAEPAEPALAPVEPQPVEELSLPTEPEMVPAAELPQPETVADFVLPPVEAPPIEEPAGEIPPVSEPVTQIELEPAIDEEVASLAEPAAPAEPALDWGAAEEEPLSAAEATSAGESREHPAADIASETPEPQSMEEPRVLATEPEPAFAPTEPEVLTPETASASVEAADLPRVESEVAPVEHEAVPVEPAEVELAATPLLQPLGSEPTDETSPEAPLSVEDMDLSGVTFGTDAAGTDVTTDSTEPAPEAPSEPAPLLDLVPPPVAEAGVPLAAGLTAGAIAGAVEGVKGGKGRKKARTPKKKAETKARGGSRKKADETADISAPAAPTLEVATVEQTIDAGASTVELSQPTEDIPSEASPIEVTASDANDLEAAISSSTSPAEPFEANNLTASLPVEQPQISASDEQPPIDLEAPVPAPVDEAPAISSGEAAATPEFSEAAPVPMAEAPHEEPDPNAMADQPVAVETIETTEPTPESALDLGQSIGEETAAPDAFEPVDASLPLSDTAFGQAVKDFSGSGLGPLVEERSHDAKGSAETADPLPVAAHEAAPLDAATPDSGPVPLEGQEFVGDIEVAARETGISFELPDFSAEPPSTLTGNLVLEQPAEMDLTLPPAPDLDLTVSEVVLDQELELEEVPEPVADLAPTEEETIPSLEAAIETAEVGDITSLKRPAAAPTSDEVAAPNGDAPDAPPINEAPTPNKAPPLEPAPPIRRPMDPYLGMQRDLGSFIGGMPLALAPSVVEAPAVRPSEPPPVVNSATPAEEQIEFHTDPDGLPELDDALFEGEEPLELFDETAEKLDALPDDLEPIADITGALAATAAAPAAASSAVTSPAAATPAVAEAPSVAAPPVLRSLTADPASAQPAPPLASAPAAAAVTVPPFAGSRLGAKAGVNAFSGLTSHRSGGRDVFSQTTFPPLDEAAFRPQPIDIPPMTVRMPGEKPAKTPAKSEQGRPPQGGWRPPGVPPAGGGPVIPKPLGRPQPGADDDEQRRSRRPWWKGIFALLALLGLLIVGAAGGIITFLAPHTYVQGLVRIQGLDKLNPPARREQVTVVRDSLHHPDLQNVVAGNLRSQGLSPGFTKDLGMLANPDNSPFEQGGLLLKQVSLDVPADRRRMGAVLSAIYRENQTVAENAPKANATASAAQKELDTLQAQLNAEQETAQKLSDQLKLAAGVSAQDLLQDSAGAIESLQGRDTQLRSALAQANSDVEKRRAALDAVQPATGPGAADPKILQIRRNLASLTARLAVIKDSAGGQPDPSQAFADALDAVDRVLNAYAGTKDSRLSAYASQAQQAETEIRQILVRQKQNAERIRELRRQVEAHRETHLRQLWSGDELLKQMLEERDAHTRELSAAEEGGSTQEAAKLRGVLDELDHRIDARRESLGSGAQYADDLQKTIELTIDRLQDTGKQNAKRIASDMALLEVPSSASLPQSEQGTMNALGEQVAGAKSAYERYLADTSKSAAGDSDAQARKLESEIAAQHAELDAYQQRHDAPAAAEARKALEAAQDAESHAQVEYATNLNLLSSLGDLKDAQSRIRDLNSALPQARDAVQRAGSQADRIPVVLAPDDSSVTVATEADQRVWYLAGAVVVLLLLFARPIWLTLRESHEEAAFATIHTERRDTPGRGDGRQFDSTGEMQEDEHAAVA